MYENSERGAEETAAARRGALSEAEKTKAGREQAKESPRTPQGHILAEVSVKKKKEKERSEKSRLTATWE